MAQITEQAASALCVANRVRLERANLMRELAKITQAEGMVLVAEWIREPPPSMTSLRLDVLIGRIHRWGPIRAAKLLRALLLPENKPLGTLTLRQREELAQTLLRHLPLDQVSR